MDQSKTNNRRRRYDTEFKLNAIHLLESGKNASELADSLGVSKQMLYNWRSQIRITRNASVQPGTNNPYTELEQLRKKLRDVEMERDILKKALNIFSRQT
ncbi:MAG: transposase [Saprospiraceae bacterium]|nr:transposase [Saprospiraceae bacterium]MBK9270524.1 transposase [Saprospiraceae bacterium]